MLHLLMIPFSHSKTISKNYLMTTYIGLMRLTIRRKKDKGMDARFKRDRMEYLSKKEVKSEGLTLAQPWYYSSKQLVTLNGSLTKETK